MLNQNQDQIKFSGHVTSVSDRTPRVQLFICVVKNGNKKTFSVVLEYNGDILEFYDSCEEALFFSINNFIENFNPSTNYFTSSYTDYALKGECW